MLLPFPAPSGHPGGAPDQDPTMGEPAAYRWIKTDCGRAKYGELAARSGLAAQIRLVWFVGIAALRDWSLPRPNS